MQAPLLHDTESELDAILSTFHDLARELRLPELSWDVVRYGDQLVVEGRPRASGDLPSCPRWARFLGMDDAGTDPAEHAPVWLGVNGPWTMEIVAAVA